MLIGHPLSRKPDVSPHRVIPCHSMSPDLDFRGSAHRDLFHFVILDRDCYLVLLHRGCVTWKSYIGIFLWVLNYEWVQMSRLAAAPGRVADRDGSIETQGGLVAGVFALGTLVFCGPSFLALRGAHWTPLTDR